VNRSFKVRVRNQIFSSGGDEGLEPAMEERVDLDDKVLVPLQKRECHIVFERRTDHGHPAGHVMILFSLICNDARMTTDLFAFRISKDMVLVNF
jgi:hypothetical protein